MRFPIISGRHLFLYALLCLCLLSASTRAQSGNGSLQLTQSVIAGGGGISSSGAFRVEGTIGQSVTATSAGGTFTLSGGFWPGAAALAPSTLSVTEVTGSYGGTVSLSATLTANGTTPGGQIISFSLNGNVVGTATTDSNGLATINNISLSSLNAGTYIGAVSAQFAGDTTFAASTGTARLTVQKASPLLQVTGGTFPYDGQPHPASASAIGVNNEVLTPVTLLYNGSSAAPVNAATYTVTASFAGNQNYAPVMNNQQSIRINQASQTITFGALTSKTYGDPDFIVSATASSGLNVSFSAVGQCAVAGSTVHITGAGSCTITASQMGNNNYSAATPTSQSFNINKAPATITLSNLSQTFDSTAKFASASTTPSGLTVNSTYSQNTTPVASPTNAGSYDVTATINDPNYQGSASGTLVISKANQSISFGDLPNKTYGAAPFTLSATASSGLPVTFSIVSGPATNSGSTVTITGVGHVIARASQSGDKNYQAASAVEQAFDVTTASTTITLSNLTQAYDGTAKTPTVATTPTGLSYALSYRQNGQTITSPTNAGSYNVTATITDPNYQGSMTGILVITKAVPVITWNNPANIVYGTPLSVTQLNATANVPGTFSYNPATGAVLSVGPHQLLATFAPSDTTNYITAIAQVSITVDQTTAPALNLDSATYSVNEADGHVTIKVNRTGQGTDAASVGYKTIDTAGLQDCNVTNGIASSRCDYTTTVGTLRFAPGETAKTIYIPLIDDAYAEGPETFSLTLSNAVGESLGTVSTATITSTDNDAANGTNPIADPSFFVRQQYIDFLDRDPDPQGYQGWQNMLNNCAAGDTACDRIAVSSGFYRSPEFQDRGSFIFRFYSAALGRNPSYAEFMPDLAKVSGFLSDAQLEANKGAFVQEFMARSEFANRYGSLSNTAFVDMLMQTSGLTSHPQRGTWIDVLNNQTATRAQVLRAFTESAEVYTKFYNQVFVVMQYFGYLRRDPDASYTQWIALLNQTGDYRTMINGFLNSNEYIQRFGP